jgi:DNA-directed RNA polymerase specialized sigma subunit
MKNMNRARSEHYVNNKDFLLQMIDYKQLIEDAKVEGKEKPRIPDEIGMIFVNIATHLSYKSNFINYGFREDMISDGIENCIQYIDNFDPNKSRNPFAYFTQIIYYAFLRRIQKEKKQLYVKYKSFENSELMDSFISSSVHGDQYASSIGIPKLYDNMKEFISTFEDSTINKRRAKNKDKKKKPKKSANTPLKFVGESI